MVNKTPINAGDVGGEGSIPGSGRSPGVGNGSLLQHSCLGNPVGRRAGWATVQRVAGRVGRNLGTKKQQKTSRVSSAVPGADGNLTVS